MGSSLDTLSITHLVEMSIDVTKFLTCPKKSVVTDFLGHVRFNGK